MPQGEAITRILAAAINAVEPGEAVKRFVQRQGDTLSIAERTYDLASYRRICSLAIGKAAVAMSDALITVLGDRLAENLVVAKHAPPSTVHRSSSILVGGHPVPDKRSLEAGRRVTEFVSALGADDLLFCLISGGGSALVTAPVEGVTLADLQALTSDLLACGARIDEINALCRRLDRVKGGGIVKIANGATVVSLILSDVIGDPLEAIASGPTAPDPTTRAEALSTLTKYELEERVSPAILRSLRPLPETPKPGDPMFAKVQNVLVGSNLLAAQAALKQAEAEGFHPYLLRTDLQGEAREVTFELAALLRQAMQSGDPVPAPGCIVAGGETTVTLKGEGKGGRNTEMALAGVSELAGFPGALMVTLATDGEDGPTDAAGAVVNGESLHRAAGMGLQPGDFLNRNDSYSFFAEMGDLLKPGPSGTNVGDLVFLFNL